MASATITSVIPRVTSKKKKKKKKMEKKLKWNISAGQKKTQRRSREKKDNCIENEKKTDNTKRPLSTGLRGFLIPPPSLSFSVIVQL